MSLRPSRPSTTWDDRDRKNLYLNVAFGLVVVAAVAILGIAFGLKWYDDHLAAAGTVNGQAITKDELARRQAVDEFRYDYEERRVRTLLNGGQLNSDDAQSRLAIIAQRKQQAATLALEALIDGRIMTELAPGEGVAITEADIDARITKDATTPELRKVRMLEIEPELAEGASVPTDEAIEEARDRAERALARLKGGGAWAGVVQDYATDEELKAAGGEIGWTDAEGARDGRFLEAVFAAELDTPTAVVEGADGRFRIGMATEKIDAKVDATLVAQLEDADIAVADHREAIRTILLRERLDEALVAKYDKKGPQRRVAQIVLGASESEAKEGAVKTRHILYSPNDDPGSAASLAEDDPAWAEAEADARAAYAKLKDDIGQFDALARAESDEGAAASSGGKLPYFAPDDAIDDKFAFAIFQDNLAPGQLLEPVRSQFGWHVIQIMRYPTDLEWANTLRSRLGRGADFADLARDNSDSADAVDGGDIGWIARGQQTQQLEDAIFATRVGGVSDPVVVEEEGIYLFKVFEEEERELSPEQRETISRQAFGLWYQEKKAAYEITRDGALSTQTG